MATAETSAPALSHHELAYLSELSADIKANGGIAEGESMEQAMVAAHARRQAIAREMSEGKTARAIKARRVLSAQIHGDAQVAMVISQIAATDAYEANVRIWEAR